ncbi:hypothetical protein XENOCAPTIV_025473 [Xenoophorus captivus]|uniref:TEX10-like TPR repeats domain-containing protein n=1 Tax=Xenoophorus captivus TaxID=1517983 RepID=A0ABV0SBK0_9TELE
MHVGDLSAEELPQFGQILSMLLQHAPLHNQLLANAVLLQELIQNLTRAVADRFALLLQHHRGSWLFCTPWKYDPQRHVLTPFIQP